MSHVACAGKTFSKPVKLIITETPNEHGRYWTWVHWELEVTTMDLFMATEVVCRAWDAAQNTQPDALTWTLLGQGNNSMFRLKLHKEVDDKVCVCVRARCNVYCMHKEYRLCGVCFPLHCQLSGFCCTAQKDHSLLLIEFFVAVCTLHLQFWLPPPPPPAQCYNFRTYLRYLSLQRSAIYRK
jgi:hypothetical protein